MLKRFMELTKKMNGAAQYVLAVYWESWERLSCFLVGNSIAVQIFIVLEKTNDRKTTGII